MKKKTTLEGVPMKWVFYLFDNSLKSIPNNLWSFSFFFCFFTAFYSPAFFFSLLLHILLGILSTIFFFCICIVFNLLQYCFWLFLYNYTEYTGIMLPNSSESSAPSKIPRLLILFFIIHSLCISNIHWRSFLFHLPNLFSSNTWTCSME